MSNLKSVFEEFALRRRNRDLFNRLKGEGRIVSDRENEAKGGRGPENPATRRPRKDRRRRQGILQTR
jgi:hypothetical protein